MSQFQAITRNKTQFIRNSADMTYILGSRCSNGVVMVADRKFTIEQSGGLDSIYDSKLYGEYEGIITGFSGLRRRYENFILSLNEFLNIQRGQYKIVPIETFLLKASEIVNKLPTRDLDVLFGIKATPSVLKHMYFDGGIETVKKYVVVGTGEPVGRFFLKRYWNETMNMMQVAELGYFVIKVIQRYRLEDTVGLSEKSEQAESKPQIWFIPDDGRDFEASDYLVYEMEQRVDSRILEIDKQNFFSDPTINTLSQNPSS